MMVIIEIARNGR